MNSQGRLPPDPIIIVMDEPSFITRAAPTSALASRDYKIVVVDDDSALARAAHEILSDSAQTLRMRLPSADELNAGIRPVNRKERRTQAARKRRAR
jgi:hypothetical protein